MNSVILLLFVLLSPWPQGSAPEPGVVELKGPVVLFYGPTREERDSLAAAEGLEIDDVLDDFNLSSGQTAVYLSSKSIPYRSSMSRVFVVHLKNAGTRRIERLNIPGPVGLLLSDGLQRVSVVPGEQTSREMISQINEFFGLSPGR